MPELKYIKPFIDSGKCLSVTMAILIKYVTLIHEASTEGREFYTKTMRSSGVVSYYKTVHISWADCFHDYVKLVGDKDGTYYLPGQIYCRNKVLEFGQRSGCSSITAIDPTIPSRPVLFTDTERRVFLDVETGKTVNVKQAMNTEQVKKLAQATSPVRYNLPTELPPNVDHCLQRCVKDQDIDENGHATFTTYIAVFTKCVNEALQEGKFKWLQQANLEIDLVYLKEFLIVYIKEGKLGDDMSASIWSEAVHYEAGKTENGPNKSFRVVYGHIKRGVILLAQCKLVFHTGTIDSNKSKL